MPATYARPADPAPEAVTRMAELEDEIDLLKALLAEAKAGGNTPRNMADRAALREAIRVADAARYAHYCDGGFADVAVWEALERH